MVVTEEELKRQRADWLRRQPRISVDSGMLDTQSNIDIKLSMMWQEFEIFRETVIRRLNKINRMLDEYIAKKK